MLYEHDASYYENPAELHLLRNRSAVNGLRVKNTGIIKKHSMQVPFWYF